MFPPPDRDDDAAVTIYSRGTNSKRRPGYRIFWLNIFRCFPLALRVHAATKGLYVDTDYAHGYSEWFTHEMLQTHI